LAPNQLSPLPSRLGPRFAIEAVFLVAVAVAVGFADLSAGAIVIVMAGAWLLVAAVEWLASRGERAAVFVRRPEPRWPGADAPAPAVEEPHPAAASAAVAVVEEPEPVPAPAGWEERAPAPETPPVEVSATAEEEAAEPVAAAGPAPAEVDKVGEGDLAEAPPEEEAALAAEAEPGPPPDGADAVAVPTAPEERRRPWWRRRVEPLPGARAAEPSALHHEHAAEVAAPSGEAEPEPEVDAVDAAGMIAAERVEPAVADEAGDVADEQRAEPRRSFWGRRRDVAAAAAAAVDAKAEGVEPLPPEAATDDVDGQEEPRRPFWKKRSGEAVDMPAAEAAAAAKEDEADSWLEPAAAAAAGKGLGDEPGPSEPEKPRRRFFGRRRDGEASEVGQQEPRSDVRVIRDAAANRADDTSAPQRDVEAPLEGEDHAQPAPATADRKRAAQPRRPAGPRSGVFRRFPPPREWSIWELEQAVREHGGADARRKREWNVTLMHLRQYANARGTLPVELDPLVRETFGDLIESRGR
jgi:hypothetical protein